MDIKGTLDSLKIDIDGISDEPTRSIVIILSNLIEYLSAEKDRRPRGKQAKKPNSSKKGKRPIDRTERIIIAPDELPADAIFKGYQTVFVQDIIIKTENIALSLKKTFLAELPPGHQGAYGPRIKALVLDLHQNAKMTESAICYFFKIMAYSYPPQAFLA